MKRALWGEFEDGSDKKHETKPHEIILPSKKAEKLKKLKEAAQNIEQKVVKLNLENPLVTQTIEVMNQTEMLQALIDTYASKSGFNNYLLNPCQMIPQIDFPPENSIDLTNEDKFAKPFWFIPPIETKFSKGVPQTCSHINKNTARAALRKSICGLVRVAGFTEATHSSLVLFTDAVEEYLEYFLSQIKDVQINENKEKQDTIDILSLEKAYFSITQTSLTSLHNYFKNEIISKNRVEIDEFKDIYQEYDKLMKESQNMQKAQYKEEDYMNFLDFSGAIPNNQTDVGNVNIMNLLESDNNNPGGNFKDIFDGEMMETTAAPEEQYPSTSSN